MRHTYLLLCILFCASLSAQDFTRQDSLRGSITPEREWWDLTYYHLSIKTDIDQKFLKGTNLVQYKVLKSAQRMQIDLQSPMRITKVTQAGKDLKVEQDGNAYFIELGQKQTKNSVNEILIEFEGNPVISKNPPWSGGVTWKKDSNGLDFIATSCQGDGASLWWPNKDHMYDEVDSMLISVTVPEHLMNVSNGRLKSVDQNADKTKTYNWFVDNPINNYGVNMNIGDYVHFSEVFDGENGPLDCDYYVLRENLDKAKEQFKQASLMLKAFEHWFGPYPFYEDSYKLVEVPYLGMEHQSSVTYGNKYANGYLGRDVSGSGWGLKFDFIIIHESGHEWFANNITYKDMADMWVHEGFTSYSENLYVDYHFGKEASQDYAVGIRKNIVNDRPIIGTYGVNASGSSDMYYKGANMLHNIRTIIENDEKWRGILRGLNKEFYHQTVTTAQIENYISKKAGINLSKVFDQYLRDTMIPEFEYSIEGSKLTYQWKKVVYGFDMPLDIMVNGKKVRIKPSTKAQTKKFDSTIQTVEVDRNYYVTNKEIKK
ncbi:M1 family metallopeptidase [Roseivirga echinicomitans]|uniref:Peptidase M1 n=1 Tax=Roseivirga echinicomitans TaxID=296218 RepID=A0A150X1Y2_9BACT|nr:M1 family metallopeptidase [Roseivirga echinicomitans]KYG72735.1 peptidase M1 [Roseivirga echinicomitans]